MLAAEGYRVLLGVRRQQDAPRLQGGEAEAIDVASTESIDQLVERLKRRRERLEVLLNNAGIDEGRPRAIWAVNVRGPLLLTRGLTPLLEDGARVVMVSSGLARGGASGSLRKRLDSLSLDDDSGERLCEDAPGGYRASKAVLTGLATRQSRLATSKSRPATRQSRPATRQSRPCITHRRGPHSAPYLSSTAPASPPSRRSPSSRRTRASPGAPAPAPGPERDAAVSTTPPRARLA
jgi:hypothetical protein